MNDHIWKAIPEVVSFMESIKGREDEIAVILVGSASRNLHTDRSDIDLLLLSKRPLEPLKTPGRVHSIRATSGDFLQQLGDGEDFEAWAVRFGIPVNDNGMWSEILKRPEGQVWPSWTKKVTHGARRLFLASGFIKTGDVNAAAEEMLYAAGHVARGLLLRAGIFPLSRPELEDQIRILGYPHLAAIHRRLRTEEEHELRFLAICQRYIKKLLVHASARDYEVAAKKFSERKRLKRRLVEMKTAKLAASLEDG